MNTHTYTQRSGSGFEGGKGTLMTTISAIVTGR